MKVYYDEDGDFLEIFAGEPAPATAEEIKPGIFIRKDNKTDEVKSIGIFNFKKRASKLHKVQVDLPLHFEITA